MVGGALSQRRHPGEMEGFKLSWESPGVTLEAGLRGVVVLRKAKPNNTTLSKSTKEVG